MQYEKSWIFLRENLFWLVLGAAGLTLAAGAVVLEQRKPEGAARLGVGDREWAPTGSSLMKEVRQAQDPGDRPHAGNPSRAPKQEEAAPRRQHAHGAFLEPVWIVKRWVVKRLEGARGSPSVDGPSPFPPRPAPSHPAEPQGEEPVGRIHIFGHPSKQPQQGPLRTQAGHGDFKIARQPAGLLPLTDPILRDSMSMVRQPGPVQQGPQEPNNFLGYPDGSVAGGTQDEACPAPGANADGGSTSGCAGRPVKCQVAKVLPSNTQSACGKVVCSDGRGFEVPQGSLHCDLSEGDEVLLASPDRSGGQPNPLTDDSGGTPNANAAEQMNPGAPSPQTGGLGSPGVDASREGSVGINHYSNGHP